MRHLLRRFSPVLLISVVVALVAVLNAHRQAATPPGAPPPIDPQKVPDQDDMTWADYKPIPGKDWADPSLKPERTLTLALVAINFDDQPFVMTLPKQSDPFGNPRIDPIKREAVPQFFADFITKPSALNHGQTICNLALFKP
jgi:hypothetical protein